MSATPWADRVFLRFAAIYGHQKLAAMFADDAEEVRQTWEEQLRRFSPEIIRRSIQSLIDASGEWPPTLPQFVGVCKDYNRPEQAAVPAALPPPTATETAQAAEQLQRIAETVSRPATWDYLAWARRPKSAQAVLLLQRGAERDSRLKDIFAAHLADGGIHCQRDEARELVQAIAAAKGAR